jgi:DNA-directed RNA polymerase subunit M/transcription elongation factor TFIIS
MSSDESRKRARDEPLAPALLVRGAIGAAPISAVNISSSTRVPSIVSAKLPVPTIAVNVSPYAARLVPKFVELLRVRGDGEEPLPNADVAGAALAISVAVARLGNAATEKCKMLFNALRDAKNVDLRNDIRSGAVTAAALLSMREKELQNPATREQDEAAKNERLRSKNLQLLRADRATPTALYRCPKCGARRCSMEQKQTRCADEPMTIFLTCLECGRVFKR